MSAGRGGGTEKEGGKKGRGDEKEVISGLFLPAFCQSPSEIFRGETHTRLSEPPANTMQDGSTCHAAYLTVYEAHKW